MADRPQRTRTIRESDVWCSTCGKHLTTMKPHLKTCKHGEKSKKRRAINCLNTNNLPSEKADNDCESTPNWNDTMSDNEAASGDDYEPLMYQSKDDSLVINWPIESRLITNGSNLCSSVVPFRDCLWAAYLHVEEDELILGIDFVSGEFQPFVHLSVELEHHLKTLSIKKNAVKVFSPASSSFGWKFDRAKVLDPDLGLVAEKLYLKYSVDLLTREDDANNIKESIPVLKNHSTMESRLLRSWMLENFITDKAMELLLKILTHPNFVASQLAPSVYLLKECDPAFIPSINIRSTVVNGVTVHYYSPVEIWQILLADPQYTTNWKLTFDRNDDIIEHPCNTDGWKEIEASLSQFQQSHRLLLPTFFCDEYLQHNTSQKYVNSILMTISNASKDMQLQVDRKYLISSLPDGVDINAVIQRVLVPSIMLLQRGEVSSYFAVTKRVEKFCGTLFNMLGDHMGQIAISGLKGPTCQRPSRYYLTPLNEMEQVRPEALKTWRSDAVNLWNSVDCASSADERDRIKLEHGLAERPSLLCLTLFAKSFYKRFGNCLLHNSVVSGNLARHLLFIGEKYGEDFRKRMNAVISQFNFPTGSEKIHSLYFDKVIRVPNGENQKEIKLSQHIGKHLEIVFAFVLIWIQTTGLVSNDDVRCLGDHIDLYYTLKMTSRWKREDLDPANGSLIKKITKVKTAIIKCFPQNEYNWRTPKFESLDAWPELIRYLGPPAFQSTDTWEATHLPNKADSMLSNHHAVELDVLKKRMSQLLFHHHQIFRSNEAQQQYESILKRDDSPVLLSVRVFGPKSCDPNKHRYDIVHMQTLLRFNENRPTKAFKCSGFVWHALRVRKGQCFAFKSPLMPDATLFGELIDVFKFEATDSALLSWLRITLFRGMSEDLSGNTILENNGNVVIPLGAGYTFSRLVHLYVEKGVAKINRFALF